MSNISDANLGKQGKKVEESEYKNFNNAYITSSKHKFECWPILWILIAILTIFVIFWYIGTTTVIVKWIGGK